MNPIQQAHGSASHVAALYLLLGLIWPMCAQGQQMNDLLQMDSPHPSKAGQARQKKEDRPQLIPKLSVEDTKKYQALVTSMEGKNGDDILKSMQASNGEKLAKMPAERRNQIERYQKKFQSELQAGKANPHYKPLDAAKEKLHLHLLGLDRGDGKQMTVQQKAYFEHLEAKIRQRYFDPERSEKNRRMLEESNAYLKLNLDRQADYRKNIQSATDRTEQTKAAPLPLDVLKSNWLVRKMATESPADLSRKASALDPESARILRAQIDDLLQQLRSNKSMSVTDRYGPGASIVSEADAQRRMQEQARNGNPATNVPPSSVNGADKGKAAVETSTRKFSPIPGL